MNLYEIDFIAEGDLAPLRAGTLILRDTNISGAISLADAILNSDIRTFGGAGYTIVKAKQVTPQESITR